MEGPPRVKLDLKPCRTCGRTFVPESLVKHEASCKNIQKKRKVFDTSKQRVTEDLSLRQIKAAQKKTVQAPKTHWKQKHEEFLRTLKSAKEVSVAMQQGKPLPPPPPPAANLDYVECPYCNRRFNEKAAERHINFCKEQSKRGNTKRVPSQQEQARAAAQKYQPPKPKGRGGDSPAGGGGYGASRGGYSSGPATRGAPAGARGTPPGARGTPPGARGTPPGGRGTPPGPAGSKSDMGRTAGGYSSGSQGYGSRGRAPASTGGVARGRPTPASQGTYAANKYPDPSSALNDPLRVLSGRSLKLRQHREDSRPSSKDKPSNQSNVISANRGAMDGNHLTSTHKSSSSSSSGKGFRGTDSGYHSSNSESDAAVPRLRKMGRPSSGTARFCHECGTKYPSVQAKFCSECGMKKLQIPAR